LIQALLLIVELLLYNGGTPCNYVNEDANFQLALMVQGECSICPIEEQIAIAKVAKNRMVIWNKSMQEVLDPEQFQGLCNPIDDTNIPYHIADSVLNHAIVDSSLFFYKKDMITSKWSKTLTVIKQYKFHSICY